MINEYSHELDSSRNPPWMRRKRLGMLQTIAHPLIGQEMGVLNYATKDSLISNYGKLLGYFINQYGLNQEVVESWLMFLSTGNMQTLKEDYMVSPTILIDHKELVAWPAEDPKQMYERLKLMEDRMDDSFVEIRIGRSTTKADVKWILDYVWDSEIKPRLSKLSMDEGHRVKYQYLRDSTAYYMHEQGISIKEITIELNKHFSPEPAKDGTVRVLEETYVRKKIKDFEPETSLLEQPLRKINDLLKTNPEHPAHSLKLIAVETPTKHFEFK